MKEQSRKITPVLLAGGAGSRLWPVSRDQLPKQFQPLVGNLSTYQQTLQRVGDKSLYAEPLVITNEDFRFFARRQAEEIDLPATVVLEPARRDSAAAMAAAAVLAERREPGCLVLALAADHVVLDAHKFSDAVKLGAKAADQGNIVVFGLVPTEPRTSYGYIKPGEAIDGEEDLSTVDAFVEKPDVKTAISYLEKGYLWNSGNFLFRSDVMIAELKAFAPEILAAVTQAVEQYESDLGFVRLHQESFEASPKNSIDYAVIEKTKRMAVVHGHFRWSDIGSWDAIWEIADKHGNDNALEGNGVFIDSEGCLIHSTQLLTTVVGAKDMVVVATKDAVLVVPKNRVQDVKGLVEKLKDSEHAPQTQTHKRVYRPWGYIEHMYVDERYRVGHITVDPGHRISFQKHYHRSEHWIVVKGTATVTIGEETRLLTENQSVYIPIGQPHRLANEGQIPLELVEIQTGAYIGEDDVIRIEDDYKRQ
ncbi:mannose-1-phosphate guanylyltransferase/mannose-6-phosphate isomerase [Agrobacterium tumefaciens]|uniref:mannose-1-phosphate guanylyltransferase/mannose-6-phosphate isomerase n=1 Tax=Agrobacterium tumefaciens TaxID=358 RepID=UPI000DCFF200|nr:mannose-1-phosphate guanylyltransferase/mannose-6-phosphate isomerase [Agrobacterium tumefaciens]MBP2534592.1 mannose-1-phosphate guanylyltransferase/mannose-1-phosphate guanylyltransferase/mannose-6-phosphate isomerase [Agrobacterium tumefaciens]MDP9788948.1 mannose-1-phosphate guanylyltransferase/mannose-1-phosphate guanylyltransferase/mannose-6-phosphate isomerase [Agrobacterium tumefaciens]MDP9855742.1 mannose-1-phosphate guanylyltransferase/mannose-1-phosphate guanylyltransferase/mannose